MKRVLSVQDISCLGKCSLTVALPIISAMGIETVILPTAVLSTHTGFKQYTMKDLDDQIIPITTHWQQENIAFDALYSGYLATTEQIAKIKTVFQTFKTTDNNIIVDPAMADHGKLYPGFTIDIVKEMATLCSMANIIVPNLTEATLLTNRAYQEHFTEEEIRDLLLDLAQLGAGIVLITGVGFAPHQTGVYGYERATEEFFYYETKRIDAIFHGTGDIFASTLTGGLVNGLSWQASVQLAADYTAEAIQATVEAGDQAVAYGVHFEQKIGYLIDRLQKAVCEEHAL